MAFISSNITGTARTNSYTKFCWCFFGGGGKELITFITVYFRNTHCWRWYILSWKNKGPLPCTYWYGILNQLYQITGKVPKENCLRDLPAEIGSSFYSLIFNKDVAEGRKGGIVLSQIFIKGNKRPRKH